MNLESIFQLGKITVRWNKLNKNTIYNTGDNAMKLTESLLKKIIMEELGKLSGLNSTGTDWQGDWPQAPKVYDDEESQSAYEEGFAAAREHLHDQGGPDVRAAWQASTTNNYAPQHRKEFETGFEDGADVPVGAPGDKMMESKRRRR